MKSSVLSKLLTCTLPLALIAPCSTAGANDGAAQAPASISIDVTADQSRIGTATTLQAALNLVRSYRKGHPDAAITVQLPAGVFRVTAPIEIGFLESGSGNGSLTIRGDEAGGTAIRGSTPFPSSQTSLDATKFTGLSSPALVYRSYLAQSEDSIPLIFAGGRRIPLARWPTNGFPSGWIVRVRPDGTFLSHPAFKSPPGINVLVTGYFTSDWAYESVPGRTVAGGILLPGYRPSSALQARPRLAVANGTGAQTPSIRIDDAHQIVLSGLEPGGSAEIAIARELLVAERAHNLIIENLAFEQSAGNGLRIYASSHVTLRNCYVGQTASKGIGIEGGDHVTIDGCVVDDTGLSGITSFGGDRTSLTPSSHIVRNSVIQRTSWRIRSYTPAVALLGTGNTLSHSTILALPHAGVGISGNDNLVEATDIHAVACETGDVGAIYMGHDWTQRGNRILGNFLHDIGTADPSLGHSAVYLDDQFSGVTVARNVILRSSQGVVIGGGRDNIVSDNIFALMMLSAIWFDQRGLGVQKAETQPGGRLYQTLMGSPFRSPLWRRRYPYLASLPDQQPGKPVGNRAERNITVDSNFLQSDPPGAFLAGEGNGQSPAGWGKTLNGLSISQQYAALSGLSTTISKTRPGASDGGIFGNRIVSVANCGNLKE